jgi:NAD(P)-dependent dehydrogenase (short-subunit alcohol dehydrogenase family)
VGKRLKDKVAIVTGSGQGVGKAIAIALAGEGAKIITNNRKQGTTGGDAEITAKEIIDMGVQAVPFFGDISEFEVAQELVRTAMNNFGRLDILVNNAGSDAPHMVWNMTEEDWDKCVGSFLKGSFNCTHFACGVMRKQRRGRIVNTTSVAWLGDIGHCNYCAAKAGIVGLTRAVAREMGKYGVTCNAYAPHAATRFTVNPNVIASWEKMYQAGFITKEEFEHHTNPPPPETVSPLVIYLCSDAAANVNGQVFHTTGGKIAIYSEPAEKRAIFAEKGVWTIDKLTDLIQVLLTDGGEHRN